MFFISFKANKLFINHIADPLDKLRKTTAILFRYKNVLHIFASACNREEE